MKKECFKGPFCSKQGFTLIELLVVVLIIGILAAVALPQYQVAVAKSRFAEIVTVANEIDHVKAVYYLANGNYPHDFSLLDIDLSSCELNEDHSVCYFRQKGFACAIYDSWTHCYNDVNYYTIAPSTNTTVSREQCAALKDNSLANKICKQQKGRYSWTNGDWKWYTIE